MMFSSFSTVVTALSGVLFFHETITLLKVIGILLMLISFYFAVEKETEKRKGNLRWLLLCITVFLGTGGIVIMQKVHQSSEYRSELTMFLVIAFICSFVFSAVSLLLQRRKASTEALFEGAVKKGVLLALFAAAGVCH